jgi:NADPH-dependent 2,4-dienoyl-CoA reductase/sulfur reductase-like enzyme
MRPERVDVAIVGGGLAGAGAAEVLAGHRLDVTILDENRELGGQYLRGGRDAAGWMEWLKHKVIRLNRGLAAAPVDIRSRTEVLGIEPGPALLAADESRGVFSVKARAVLIATGARERFVPFKGWTLPGVLSTGAVQILIKQYGVLPAWKTLVAGAGLFLPTVARDILRSGGRVAGVWDEMPFAGRMPAAGLALRHGGKFLAGGAVLARLLFARVPVQSGTRILEARGDGELREVVAGRLDRRGEVIPGSETVTGTGSLAVGYGFAANTDLAQLAGCDLGYHADFGGWVVQVNEDLETSVPGIFAAGEITAIGGAAKALTEGRLAARAILRHLGITVPHEGKKTVSVLKHARRRQLAFARFFNRQYLLDRHRLQALYGRLEDDVPICRCENARLGDIRRAVADGFATPGAVKKATRCAMGVCQGSTCKPILLDVLSVLTGTPPSHIPLPSVRMPLKPVNLGFLAGEPQRDPR